MEKCNADDDEICGLSEEEIENIVADRLPLEDIEDDIIEAAIEIINDIKENSDVSSLLGISPNTKHDTKEESIEQPDREAAKTYTYKDLWNAADKLYYIDKESFARILFTMRARSSN